LKTANGKLKLKFGDSLTRCVSGKILVGVCSFLPSNFEFTN